MLFHSVKFVIRSLMVNLKIVMTGGSWVTTVTVRLSEEDFEVDN